MNNRFKLQSLVWVLLFLMAGTAIATTSASRQVVRTQDDLPRHSYPVSGTAVELFNSDDATFNAWAAKVNADIEDTLERYDIEDHATLRDLLQARLAYQVLTHQNQDGLDTIARLRTVEDKPDAKLMSALATEAILKARIETGRSSGPIYAKAYAEIYANALAALPWAITANRIKEEKAWSQLLTADIMEGFIKAEVEPAVAHDHAVSATSAHGLLSARMRQRVEIPVQKESVAALTRIVAANDVAKQDIWAAREVTLTAADTTTPVVAAVWDSGTDLSLFPDQTYTAPDPATALPFNAHGLAFDLDSKPTTGWLYPLTPAQEADYRARIADIQGLNDMQQSIDSPAAEAIKAKFAAMPSDQVPAYFEQLNLYGIYLHGTHVAGIMARGNPAIRLAVARLSFDHRNVPAPPTEENQQRLAQAFQVTVDWFRTHGVRVVNMSWGVGPKSYETDLEKNGIGKDAADRKALARHYFDIIRNSLLAALKSAPEILFVCAAGNSDSDNGFDESIPSSFALPNLLTVSAVDLAGDEAGFTSYGKNVVVTANGYQVPSTIPGGGTLSGSGTSMASPNVANLAAKLIALDPTLTPAETIQLIRAGATASADGRRHNIDPSASVRLLRERLRKG